MISKRIFISLVVVFAFLNVSLASSAESINKGITSFNMVDYNGFETSADINNFYDVLDDIDYTGDDYTISAGIEFRSEKKQIPVAKKSLSLDTNVIKPESSWVSNNLLLTWKKKVSTTTNFLDLPINDKNIHKSIMVDNFNEYAINFRAIPGVPVCNIDFIVNGYEQKSGAEKQKKPLSAITYDYSLANKEVILFEKDNYKRRDFFYLFERFISTKPDGYWRSLSKDGAVLIQKRMHLPLANKGAMEIRLSPEISLKHINLSISTKDDFGVGKIIEIPYLPEKSLLKDGSSGVYLDLNKIFTRYLTREWNENNQIENKNKFYLQELFIHISGKESDVIQKRPVKSITLYDREIKATRDQTVLELNKKSERLVSQGLDSEVVYADLNPLISRNNITIDNSMVRLSPDAGKEFCAIQLGDLQMIKSHTSRIPSYLDKFFDLSQTLGISRNRYTNKFRTVSSLNVTDYMPFSTFAYGKNDDSFKILDANGIRRDRGASKVYSSTGAVINVGNIKSSQLINNSLSLKGITGVVEFNWPIRKSVDNEASLYFNVSRGAGNISSLSAEIVLDNRVVYRDITPNVPVKLLLGKADIKNMKLTIRMKKDNLNIDLNSMVLYSPKEVKYSDVLNEKLPVKDVITPDIEGLDKSDSVLGVKPGEITGIVGAKHSKLNFTTRLNSNVKLLKGISLRHQLPVRLYESSKCQLSIKLNWYSGSVIRDVCLKKHNGTIYIPISSLLGELSQESNLGSLNSIDWTIKLPGANSYSDIEAFNFSIEFDVVSMLSVFDEVMRLPVFSLSGNNVYFKYLDENGNPLSKYIDSDRYVVNELDIKKSEGIKESFKIINNPLFEIKNLVLKSLRKTSGAEINGEISQVKNRLLKPDVLLIFLVATIALLYFRKKIYAQINRISFVILRLHENVNKFIEIFFSRNAQKLAKLFILVYMFGSLFIVFASWWISNKSAHGYSSVILLIVSAIVGWGAYLYHATSYDGLKLKLYLFRSSVVYITLFVVTGSYVWVIASNGLNSELFWPSLILLSILYVLLPVFLKNRGVNLVCDFSTFKLGVYAFLSLIFYGIGFIFNFNDKNNYYFLMGAIAVILSFRLALLILKPYLDKISKEVSNFIFDESGGIYFIIALIMLVFTAFSSLLNISPLAQQLSLISYYCLILGVVKGVLNFISINTVKR